MNSNNQSQLPSEQSMEQSIFTDPKVVMPTGLAYIKSTKTIEAVTERTPMRSRSQEMKSDIKAGATIKIVIRDSEFIDLRTLCLHYDLECDDDDRIANAVDVVEDLSFIFCGQEVEHIEHANTWSNVFLGTNANKSYFNTEGSAMLAITNQVVNADEGKRSCDISVPDGDVKAVTYMPHTEVALSGAVSAANRATLRTMSSYVVPLSHLSCFCNNRYYLPLLGNELSVNIKTALDRTFLSLSASTGSTYTLNNVFLSWDRIKTQPVYRARIMQAIEQSQNDPTDAMRMPFTSYETKDMNLQALEVQTISFDHTLNNALSLHMLRNNVNQKAKYVGDTYKYGGGVSSTTGNAIPAPVHRFECQSYPLPTFKQLDVYLGGTRFTPVQGLQGFTDLYRAAELCHATFRDLSGSGIIDARMMKDYYYPMCIGMPANAIPASVQPHYGLCLMSINLEKLVAGDDELINQGVGKTNYGRVQITLTTTPKVAAPAAIASGADKALREMTIDMWDHMWPVSGDKLLVNIVHRRALIYQTSGVRIDK